MEDDVLDWIGLDWLGSVWRDHYSALKLHCFFQDGSAVYSPRSLAAIGLVAWYRRRWHIITFSPSIEHFSI